MFLKKRNSAILIFTSMSLCLNSFSGESIHIAKHGENISSILFELGLKPIYGKKGALRDLLELNPVIKKRRKNAVYAGDVLLMPDNFVQAKPSLEVSEVPLHFEQAPEVEKNQIVAEKPVRINEDKIRGPSDNFKQGFFWKLAPTLSWKSLKSTDENSYRRSEMQALSQTCYGADITYGMLFDEDLTFYSKFSLERLIFKEENSINLSKTSFLSTGLSFGGLFQKKYGVEVGIEDQYLLTSSQSNTIEAKKVTIPKINFNYFQNVYENHKAFVTAIYSGRVYMPRASSDIETQFGYGASIGLHFMLENQAFDIGYDYNVLKAKSNSTDAQNIYWKFVLETP